VSSLNYRVFSFCVANKEVGFHILEIQKIWKWRGMDFGQFVEEYNLAWFICSET
jgi:hypothetical protein